MRSCLDGYLTPECADCPFWCDGSSKSKGIGCGVPFPIDRCEAFKKMMDSIDMRPFPIADCEAPDSEEEVDAVQDSIDMLPYPWTVEKYNEIYGNSEDEK